MKPLAQMHGDRNRLLRIFSLINSSWGLDEALRWHSVHGSPHASVVASAHNLLSAVPPAFGYCMLLSSSLAAMIRDKHDLPAVAVAGNLSINDEYVFKMESPLPDPSGRGELNLQDWRGHCWVDIGGWFVDASIFRSAYLTQPGNILSTFFHKNFGEKKGAICWGYDDADEIGLSYEPVEVLSEKLMHGCVAGLGKLLNQQV